ncbi:hypothetical protein Tco_0733568 [Tanacetum coccineum]
MPPANNGSTEDVQPPVVQIQSRNPNPEPNVSPVDTPIPKASIPFPSRRNDERRKEKANEQIEKFYEIFKDMNFEISFLDLSLSELTPTCMTLELADRSITTPIGIAKDVRVLVGKFHFQPIFVGKEAITFNLDQTSRYTANFNHMTANRIDVIDMASEEYSQEVLGFSDSVAYGNPSPCFDPIVANSSPTLTPFGESDFLLFEEANAFLALDDDTT